MTSEEPQDDRCAAKCRDGGYCTQYPVTGRDRCKMHGGTQPVGEDSPNFKHGAFSDHFEHDYTDEELEAKADFVDAAVDGEPGEVQELFAEAAYDVWVTWKRTKDARFMREFRQLCEAANITPEDVVQLEHSGAISHEHGIDLDDRQHAHLDAITDGPADIEVEPVQEVDQ